MRSLLDFYTMPRPGGLPMNILVYGLLLAGCWGYALWRGGAPERIGATILGIGSVLTAMAASNVAISFKSVETGILVVDLAASVAFLALALRADRFWPLWVAAFQILGTAGHGVKYVDPEVLRRTYAFIIVFWSYLMIALLVIGTWRHQQRVARLGSDHSWSIWKSG